MELDNEGGTAEFFVLYSFVKDFFIVPKFRVLQSIYPERCSI